MKRLDRTANATRLLAALCLLLPACHREPALTCEVDLGQAAEGWVAVACRARDLPAGPASIKQMAQDAVVRASDFSARTSSGEPLEVIERPDLSMGRQARSFTERTLAPEHVDFDYRYRVRPGAWAGDAMRGSRGRRLGWLDARGGLLSGRNLLLLPSSYRSLETIDLRFLLPESWVAAGTLPGGPTGFRVRGAGSAAAAVVESAIGLGPFRETRVETPGGALRFVLHEDLPAATRETVLRAVPEGFAYLATKLGPRGRDYTLVLAPPPPDGSLILVPASTAGYASEIRAPGPAQLNDLFLAMGRTWTGALATGTADEGEEGWLSGALPSFHAVGALEAAGIRGARDSWALRARGARQAGGSLTDASRAAGEEARADLLAKGTYLLAASQILFPRAGTPPAGNEAIREVAASSKGIPEEWIEAVNGIAPLDLPRPPALGSETAGPGGRRLRLLVTAGTHGMLEVCGCKARQLGGLARRETIRRELSARGAPIHLVDLGNAYTLERGDPILSATETAELELFLEMMGREPYAATALGHAELLRGPGFFESMAARRPLPYLNANLRHAGRPLAAPSRVTQAGGLRVGWISALEPRDYTGDHARFYEEHLEGIEIGDAADSLAASARGLAGQADLIVAIGSLSPRLVRRLLEQAPEIGVFLSTEGPDAAMDGTLRFHTDGESELMGLLSGRLVFFSTGEGKWLEELTLEVAAEGSIRRAGSRNHLLSEEVPEDPAFKARLASFYASMGGAPELAGSDEPVARRLPALLGAPYVGEAACRSCHEAQWRDWRESPHGSAFAVLLSRHRHYAPGCVGCHVTGYGHPSGYRIGDTADAKRHVQCEMCHGPGGAHAQAPSPRNIVRRPPREACLECHAPDHSDMNAENFDDYYRRTLHAGAVASR